MKGLLIRRDEQEEDYSQFFLDLEASDDEPVVISEAADSNGHRLIRMKELLYGDLTYLASFPVELQKRLQAYKERITSYQFSGVQIKEATIDVATEIFTRLNVSGRPLTVFEVMVAKTALSRNLTESGQA